MSRATHHPYYFSETLALKQENESLHTLLENTRWAAEQEKAQLEQKAYLFAVSNLIFQEGMQASVEENSFYQGQMRIMSAKIDRLCQGLDRRDAYIENTYSEYQHSLLHEREKFADVTTQLKAEQEKTHQLQIQFDTEKEKCIKEKRLAGTVREKLTKSKTQLHTEKEKLKTLFCEKQEINNRFCAAIKKLDSLKEGLEKKITVGTQTEYRESIETTLFIAISSIEQMTRNTIARDQQNNYPPLFPAIIQSYLDFIAIKEQRDRFLVEKNSNDILLSENNFFTRKKNLIAITDRLAAIAHPIGKNLYEHYTEVETSLYKELAAAFFPILINKAPPGPFISKENLVPRLILLYLTNPIKNTRNPDSAMLMSAIVEHIRAYPLLHPQFQEIIRIATFFKRELFNNFDDFVHFQAFSLIPRPIIEFQMLVLFQAHSVSLGIIHENFYKNKNKTANILEEQLRRIESHFSVEVKRLEPIIKKLILLLLKTLSNKNLSSDFLDVLASTKNDFEQASFIWINASRSLYQSGWIEEAMTTHRKCITVVDAVIEKAKNTENQPAFR